MDMKQLASDILTGYITEWYTPQDAAEDDVAPERYLMDAWACIMEDNDIEIDDARTLYRELLRQITEEMEG